eukprot:TRINITY_DN178_c0_g2_i11.p1 TRINITY_DN178_c0_g2~~TRINITY_DN178_c0_g2_i11.p1  ORF type:complete len:187 (+),score=43.85 TRINITY_DN178_c0_g2_i11:601-1161(+)
MRFSPDGEKLLVGSFKGKCFIYSLDNSGLHYTSVMTCKNRYGRYSGGRKVVGIHFISNSEVLITTADSRLRLMNLDDFSQRYKYKGHVNTQVQMAATMGEEHVICGSEDGKVCVWNKTSKYIPSINPKLLGRSATHNDSFEYFQPFGGVMVTNALFVPSKVLELSLIHICRCRRLLTCRSRWSPYH